MNLPLSRRHLLATAALALPGAGWAQAWPAKPVTLIVPFPAGGGTDAFARPMGAQFTRLTGKPMVIDSKGGAGGTLGASIAAKASADGHTLFMGGAHHMVAPSIYPKLDYDIEKDFVPLIQVASVPMVLVVNPRRAHTGSFQELMAEVRKNPGKLNYASAGAGSVHQLAGELFKQQTKTFITHIPYRGAGPALQDLIAGNVDMAFDGLGSSSGHVKGGRLKALMVAGGKRNPAIADVPCAAELGLPQYDVSLWYGVWAPKGTPAEVQARATEDIRKACQEPDARAVWAAQGADFPGVAGAQFAALIHNEIKTWARVVQVSGAKLE